MVTLLVMEVKIICGTWYSRNSYGSVGFDCYGHDRYNCKGHNQYDCIGHNRNHYDPKQNISIMNTYRSCFECNVIILTSPTTPDNRKR